MPSGIHPSGDCDRVGATWNRPANSRHTLWLFALATSLAVVALGNEPLPSLGEVRLKDQFGQEHRLTFPGPTPLVLTVADRKGSEEIADWVKPFKERFGDRLQIHGVADLASVPGFLQGRIQRTFQKQQAHPVMLDWSGALPKRLACVKDAANIFVVDRQGAIVFQTSGAATPGKLKDAITAIDLLEPRAPVAVTAANQAAKE